MHIGRLKKVYLFCLLWAFVVLFLFIYSSCHGFAVIAQTLQSLTTTKTKSVLKKNILFIIGPGRTGTTLLGELFNVQENVLYIFEPLRAVQEYHELDVFSTREKEMESFYAVEAQEFLKDFLTCNYRSKHDHYLRLLDNKKLFRHKSNKLNKPPFCTNTGQDCSPITAELMNKMCTEANFNLVIKELSFRMPYKQLSSLEEIDIPEKYEMRIIHSVRDPRAFLNSKYRLGWFGPDNVNPNKRVKTYTEKTCSVMLKNLKYFDSIKVGGRVKYKILRFEDLQRSDLEHFVRSLEDFLNFKQDIDIGEFLRNKTRATELSHRPIRTHAFSTSSRDISYINKRWRLFIGEDLVDAIHTSCTQVMKLLGYKIIASMDDMRNISSNLVMKPLVGNVLT